MISWEILLNLLWVVFFLFVVVEQSVFYTVNIIVNSVYFTKTEQTINSRGDYVKNKLMIIAYNDKGECYIQNYCDGEITVTKEGEQVLNRDGWCMAAKIKHINIEMKKLHEHNLTLNDLDYIIDKLKSLREYMTRESEE